MPPKSTKRSRKDVEADEAGPAPAPQKTAKLETVTGVCLCVGINCFGQVGVGDDISERKNPALVKKGSLEDKKVIAVAAGGMHTAVVTEDGKIHTFGCNDEGALGRVSKREEDNFIAHPADGLDGVHVVSVTAGDSHTAALTDDGRVLACGVFRDDDGSLAFSDKVLLQKDFAQIYPLEGQKSDDPATHISSGADHLLILTKAGIVYSLGTGKQGQLGRITERFSTRDSCRDIKGETPKEILDRRTTVQFLRRILVPQKVNTRAMKKIVSIGTGTWSSWAIDEAGQVWAWGLNNYHQLGIDRPEGGNPEWNCVYTPQRAERFDGLSIKQICGGQHHSIALNAEKKVYTLGRGDAGRLGVGNTTEFHTPQHVAALDGKNIVAVSAGAAVSYATAADGSAFGWGFGENLQLTGDEEDANAPKQLGGQQLEKYAVLHVEGGGQHAVMFGKEK